MPNSRWDDGSAPLRGSPEPQTPNPDAAVSGRPGFFEHIPTSPRDPGLLDFFVRRVFALKFTIFFEFQSLGGGPAILGRHVSRHPGHATGSARGALKNCLNPNLLLCHLPEPLSLGAPEGRKSDHCGLHHTLSRLPQTPSYIVRERHMSTWNSDTPMEPPGIRPGGARDIRTKSIGIRTPSRKRWRVEPPRDVSSIRRVLRRKGGMLRCNWIRVDLSRYETCMALSEFMDAKDA